MTNLVSVKAWCSRNILQLVLEKKSANSRKIESLDGLRGIAVLLVFLEHITGNVFPEDVTGNEAVWSFLLNFGKAGMGRSGVYLFFVLSSFLLTSQLLRPSLDLKSTNLWLNYALKRTLRIYPLYTFVLLVYSIFPGFKYDTTDVLKHLTLQEGLNHFWTIPVEIKYYLFLPLVVWLFVAVLRRNLLLATLVCTIIIIVSEIVESTIWSNRLSMFPHLSIFLMGSLAALVHAEILQFPQDKRQRIRYGMEFVAIITFLIILFTLQTFWSQAAWGWMFSSQLPRFPSNHWLYVVHGCLWSVFLVSHLHGQGFISKILCSPPLRFIGIVSFGIYLWHIAVLGYLNAHLSVPSFVKFLAISTVTLATATVTYITIERPFMRLKIRRLEARA